jgi:hypothetical protein
MKQIRIYCDNEQEGRWFSNLSPKLNRTRPIHLGKRGTNPRKIERLLRYDRPDIVVTVGGIPKLIVEKTREVPTGHNVTQRFGRLANAVEESVMIVYFLPFKARKHGKHASDCYISARLFMALERMQKIHGVPALAVEWPSTRELELKKGRLADMEMRELVTELASHHFNHKGLRSIARLQQKMRMEKERRTRKAPATAKPPKSVKILATDLYLRTLSRRFPSFRRGNLPQSFLRRKKTLVYRLGMTSRKCRREDPYTGTQFLYDYVWCRNGKSTAEKRKNLILDVPHVRKRRWLQANPNSPNRKSALYYATANLITLKDGFIQCENKVGRGRLAR